tara:strand:+ start:841 stop:1419 length:579 start_codon:yes stop_codon:yes gene_type:complete
MASASGFIKPNRMLHTTNTKDWENSISLYGDSCTWGYDLESEQRLHNVINCNRIVNNFAYPGESNVHMLMRLLDNIERYGYPYMVVMGWSSPYRMAKFAPHQIEPMGGWDRKFNETLEENKIQFTQYNLLLFETVRRMLEGKTKLFEWTFFEASYDDEQIYYPEKLDVAKDGKHPGPKTIELVAREIEYAIW